ncbi:hypothetical protein AALB39_26550 [Lachnospiraceae bacterium 54-53]
MSVRNRRQLRANLARSQKSGLLLKRKLPGTHHRRSLTRRKLRRPWVIALAQLHQNLLTLPLRAKLARSLESYGRTAISPGPLNACGVTVKPPGTGPLPMLALLIKRRQKTVSAWRNLSSAWKRAVKS